MLSQDAIYRFGPFRLSTRTHELYKQGTKLRLRRQPCQILLALVERPNDVVTREELRARLWQTDTFVDFENGLNTAIKELRGVLSDSVNEPRYIETLPTLGYRIIVPVECEVQVQPRMAVAPSNIESNVKLPDRNGNTSHPKRFYGDEPDVSALAQERSLAVPATDRPMPTRSMEILVRSRWPLFVGVAAVLLVAVAGYLQWFRSRSAVSTSTGRVMLAVLPFENLTGDANQDYFSDGLTEEMIGQLGRLDPQRLGVIARTSVMHYKRAQEPLQQIGRELAVQYVLEGSVRRDSDKVRISAQLIQIKDQTHLWSRQYDREVGGLLALQSEIAREAADEIQMALGAKRSDVAAHTLPVSASDSEAYDSYLRGRYFWNKRTGDGFRQAARYFQQAIAKDPRNAGAYAGLADTFALMSTWRMAPQNEFMPKARAAALQALELDESLAEAHASLALIAENYDYDWQTAEKEFKRAIQLAPSYATAHQWYAEYLSWQGRFEEALAESERARALDPLSLIIATDHGAILYYARQYDRAIAQCRVVLDMNPHFSRARGFLVLSHVHEGKFAEALSESEEWSNAHYEPWNWSEKAYVYGRWGRAAEAQAALARFEQLVPGLEFDPTAQLLLAYVGTSRNEEAIALLQKALSEHSNIALTLRVEPTYDSLRGDPRFQNLLLRIFPEKK